MKREIINNLDEIIDISKNINNPGIVKIKRIVYSIKEEINNMGSDWKSVNTPPKNDNEVIVTCYKKYGIDYTRYCLYEDNKYLMNGNEDITPYVSHWMYMPEPYKF